MRIFPVYFRVGFYGPKAEELQGKEFIYKVPGETRLGHIQAHLKEKHAKKVGGVLDDVLILQVGTTRHDTTHDPMSHAHTTQHDTTHMTHGREVC